MAENPAEREHAGVTDLVTRLVDGLGQLIAQHAALARLELGDEARSVGRALGTMALFIPLLVVGYALLCLGAALGLSGWLTVPGAVVAVGGLNLLAGGIGLWRVRHTLRQPVLHDTAEVFRESARALGAAAPPEVPGVH